MARKPAGWLPALTRIKTGRGRVRIPGGRDHYFGEQGDWPEGRDAPEAILTAYRQLMAEWLSGALIVAPAQRQGASVTCGEVCRAYYAAMFGRSVRAVFPYAARAVYVLCDTLPAAQFDAGWFDRCRAWHLRRGVAPRTAQWYVGRIRTAFRWAARPERKLVPPSVALELSLVTPLVDEDETPIEAAPVGDVLAAVDAACPRTRTMLRLQLLTGMRPGEVCQLRPCDVTVGPDCWVYRPAQYKTRRSALVRRAGGRKVWLGPQARNILADWLMRYPTEGYAFRSNRRKPVCVRCYRESVHAACERAGVPQFDPRQVRHTTATMLESEMGLEYAQNVLGHSRPDMTKIYAHAADARAQRAMARLG